MKKVLGIVFAALLVATMSFSAPAQAAHGRNGAAALGLLGGVAIGAAIADSNRRDSRCDRYGNCYGDRYYAAPRASRGGLVYNDEKDCWVRRSNYWGPCRAY